MRGATALAVFLFAVLLVAAHTTASGSSPRASLRLAGAAPLTLKGLHFKRAERVRLAVSVEGVPTVRWIRTRSDGSFAAAFVTVDYDPCMSTLLAFANGRRGSRAELKIPQRECPPRL
jgi:hypothetical protein